MKHAYLIYTEYEYEAMRILNEVGYVESIFELTPDMVRNLAYQAKFASERIKQLPSYKDGWTAEAETAESYYRNFTQLFHLLRYGGKE